MIDLNLEQPIGLETACKSVPGRCGEKPLHLSTMFRWIVKGVQGPDGSRVRLEAVKLGSRWMTTRQALQRFAERLTPRAQADASAGRTPGQRQRAAEQAGKELAAIGI
jgi:hypothetical protein